MPGIASPSPAGGPSEWPAILDAYRDGVRVLQRLGSKYVDWSLPTPCSEWIAVELAGHLLCTARYHHRLLAAALSGSPLTGLPTGEDLAAFHRAELATLGVTAGADRIVAFDAIATRYGERLAEIDPDLVLGSWVGIGPLTVEAHTRRAAAGWHLHAWDLADALKWGYRPRRPEVLVEGDIPPGVDPWAALLAASGRSEPDEPRPLGP